MARSAKIAKNTTYLTVASIVQKIVSFAYFGYLADALGESNLGRYSFALTFTSLFIIFMDFGLGPLLTREVAKDENKIEEWYRRVLSMKIILIGGSLLALVLSIFVGEAFFERITRADTHLVLFASLIIIFDTITFTFFSVMRAVKRLHWEAMSIVMYQVTILICGYTALRLELPLVFVLGALLAGSVLQTAFMGSVVRFKEKLRFQFIWDWKKTKKLLILAAPFAVAGIIFRINGSADILMLKTLVGDAYAGWYSLAFKLAFALTVLPGAFIASYYPAVSTYYKHSKDKLHTVFESAFFYMMILSFPISVGVIVLGDEIIQTVWDDVWRASVKPLWILMLALPFIFFNYPVGNFLNAVDKQKLNTVNMCIALAVNIALNIVLIPIYTFNGAAIAALASSVVLVLLGIPWVYKVAPFNIGYIVKKIILVGLSAGTMGFILFMVQENYHLLVQIPLGAIIYAALLLALGAVTPAELKSLKSSLLKR